MPWCFAFNIPKKARRHGCWDWELHGLFRHQQLTVAAGGEHLRRRPGGGRQPRRAATTRQLVATSTSMVSPSVLERARRWSASVGGMVGAGSAASHFSLDLEFLNGVLHYGMYLGVCIVLRLVMGMAAF